MGEQNEIRASRDEVEEFVGKLRGFHDSIGQHEQAMLETILESALGETGGYLGSRFASDEAWNELVGLLVDDDAQGFTFYYEVYLQRADELVQEAERTSLIRRLRKSRRERESSPDDGRRRS